MKAPVALSATPAIIGRRRPGNGTVAALTLIEGGRNQPEMIAVERRVLDELRMELVVSRGDRLAYAVTVERHAGIRVGAWVKPFAIFKPGVNPAYAWEPVLFKPLRPLGRDRPTVRDWVSANVTLRRGVSGAKPDEFCRWLFDLVGLDPTDDFEDVFPGSGAVGRAWETWRTQLRAEAVA